MDEDEYDDDDEEGTEGLKREHEMGPVLFGDYVDDMARMAHGIDHKIDPALEKGFEESDYE